jgi:hypothetical protein
MKKKKKTIKAKNLSKPQKKVIIRLDVSVKKGKKKKKVLKRNIA